jgi:hypothetical protein
MDRTQRATEDEWKRFFISQIGDWGHSPQFVYKVAEHAAKVLTKTLDTFVEEGMAGVDAHEDARISLGAALVASMALYQHMYDTFEHYRERCEEVSFGPPVREPLN